MNHRRAGPKVERITDATGNVYFVSMGGEDGDVVRFAELYDSRNDCWRDLAAMVPRRSGDGAVAYRFPQRDPCAVPVREIYYIGGASLPDGSDPTDTFQILTLNDPSDPSDIGSWTQGPNLPTPARSISAATIGNKVYVVGGWNPKAAYTGDGEALRLVQVYNPDSAIWSYSQELPEAVYGHRVLAVNNVDAYGNPAPELHVFGGRNNMDDFTNNHFVLPFHCTTF